jgi:hypothetical protein
MALGLALFAVFAGAQALAARESTVSHADREAIRSVVQAQLVALREDKAELAFSYATPEVQRKSGSPERFMAMVRQSYQPVYRPRAVFFQNVTLMDGVPIQRVLFLDRNGAAVMAVFPMQRQVNGAWKIAGCMLYDGNSNML